MADTNSNPQSSSPNPRLSSHRTRSHGRLRSGSKRSRQQRSEDEGDEETSSLHELADKMEKNIRSLVPLQMQIIQQQQTLHDQAVAMIEKFTKDESQWNKLCNILMSVENMGIPYSFTIDDVVQYHLFFAAAIEWANGHKKRRGKKRRTDLVRDNFYKTYLRATVQCAWNCALSAMG